MIAYLTGNIIEKSTDGVILLVNGVGYLIFCSSNTYDKLPKVNEDCGLYIKTVIREDAFELYGFISKEEKNLFNLLTSVSGIGPKTAIGILGSMNIQDFKAAVALNDTIALSRAPGIGKKTAQRIALELKDKIGEEMLISQSYDDDNIGISTSDTRDARAEALIALKTLGYTQNEASDAIKSVLHAHKNEDLHPDEIIRFALKAMSEA